MWKRNSCQHCHCDNQKAWGSQQDINPEVYDGDKQNSDIAINYHGVEHNLKGDILDSEVDNYVLISLTFIK